MIKAGFSGEEDPRLPFPSCIAEDYHNLEGGAVGNTAWPALTYPISGGIVHDWESMKGIWNYSVLEIVHVHVSAYLV